ncbi:hypothetical protein BASA61_000282 [Batrachochytrium salamandrivorans]|nr:hypothetical protein BASA60_010141 [Batrachochytrium salamandrivorans]KAH6578523.1 hypothetical protein BASA61_000282 [Batrachochytrium salamandrivorans]KAH9277360.1 hypothetical protein BASA83_000227 [Batrachochytrium salamandrivorans]
MAPRIEPSSVLEMGFQTFAAALTIVAIVCNLIGTAFIVRRGLRKRFTAAIASLILINIIPVFLQISEALYLYHHERHPGFKTWRNWCFGPSLLLLNIIQLEIVSIFNVGLIQSITFQQENMPYVRMAAVLVHVLFAGPTYFEGIIFVNTPSLPFGRWSMYGTMAYSFMVASFGISQNIFVFRRVQTHINSLSRHSIAGRGAPNTTGARRIRMLLIVVMMLDCTAFVTYILSMAVGGLSTTGATPVGYSMQQCVFAIAGIHQYAESSLFQMIVDQLSFRTNSDIKATGQPSGRANPKRIYFGDSGEHSPTRSNGCMNSPTIMSPVSPSMASPTSPHSKFEHHHPPLQSPLSQPHTALMGRMA